MLGQIWSALTGKSQSAVLSAQLDPIVKYRLALYLTTSRTDGTAQLGRGGYVRKLTTTETK